MAQSLAVKYRPMDWNDVVGQESIVKVLKQEFATNNIKNCYLFCGASGCGKTTLARIVANKINKGVGESIEIDAASNNSVDNVREIVRSASERSLNSEYKVVVLDECHALSNQAWQAFLKCIEEPPKYTIFIFCTTDPQKIPLTILNRVERFNFSKIPPIKLKARLEQICIAEQLLNYAETIEYISKTANGGMRDAISMLDKCASLSKTLDIKETVTILGKYSYDTFFELANACIDDREDVVFKVLSDYYNQGYDFKHFIDEYLTFILDVTKFSIFKQMDLLTIPNSYLDDLTYLTKLDAASKYFLYVADKLLKLKQMSGLDSNLKATVELILLQIARYK